MFGKDYKLNEEFCFTCPEDYIKGYCENCHYMECEIVSEPAGNFTITSEIYKCRKNYWEFDLEY